MSHISLHQAQTIVAAALAEGRQRSLKPLTVAVLDPGSHLIALGRDDGASTLRPQIAIAKASGALGLGMSSRAIAEMAETRSTFVNSLTTLAPNGLIAAAGGLIVYGESGAIYGAVGITGDTSENDEACAMVGIAASGLRRSA